MINMLVTQLMTMMAMTMIIMVVRDTITIPMLVSNADD
jgi:hypothetical protein